MRSGRRFEMFEMFSFCSSVSQILVWPFLLFPEFLFLLVAFSTPCPSPVVPHHGRVTCFSGKCAVDCDSNLPTGTVAVFSCEDFYELSGSEVPLKCRSDGRWSSSAPKCVPDCGRERGFVSLIANGMAAPRGGFPWHVAIYNLENGQEEYWCGGSLTSESTVVTAAHCVWGIPPANLVLVFGKFYRRYDLAEENTQTRRAKKVEMLTSYQDVDGNYNGDIAVVFLQEPVIIDRFSAPVCIDWEQRLVDLVPGAVGLALGWGLTENDSFSDTLRAVRIPVVSDENCIAAQEQDFRKFVTYTSFCAGFANGTGVCNGDSGGGLTFLDKTSGRWYLQGLVSVSPRRKGTPFCDLDFYTVFTKVGAFVKWLEGVVERESRSEDKKRSSVGSRRINAILFQHSEKMLELAKLAKRPKRQKRGPFFLL